MLHGKSGKEIVFVIILILSVSLFLHGCVQTELPPYVEPSDISSAAASTEEPSSEEVTESVTEPSESSIPETSERVPGTSVKPSKPKPPEISKPKPPTSSVTKPKPPAPPTTSTKPAPIIETKTIPCRISEPVKRPITFTVTWSNKSSDVTITIITPKGKTIKPTTMTSGKAVFSGQMSDNGTWYVKATGANMGQVSAIWK